MRLIDILKASSGEEQNEYFVQSIIERIKEQNSVFKLTKSIMD